MPFRGGGVEVEDLGLHARRLHFLFDHLPALVAYCDRDQRAVIANAAYLEWFGLAPEQIHLRHASDVLGADLYAESLPHITDVLAGEGQLFDRTFVDASGHRRHTQVSYVPDVLDGQVIGFFILVTDVSPRVEAQRAMDEAQHLAKLGSWSLDVATGVVVWSKELYRIWGVDPAVFVPGVDDALARIDPRDEPLVRATLDQALAAGDDYDVTYRIGRPDGRIREVRSQGHPHTDGAGVVVRLTGTLQDVTDTNRAARDLSLLNTQLRQVNQLNADVLAMLGHDVRAPLTVVLGYLEALVDSGEPGPPDRRQLHLERVLRAAVRLRGLVDNILAMARVDHGRITVHGAEIRVVDEIREALLGVSEGAGVAVSDVGNPTAWADAFHVRQIVANLVTNAFRYGAAPVTVHVGAGPGATVVITVADHGPGVEATALSTLFDRFTRGRSGLSLDDGSSTGLGLYIAAGLAIANAGRLEYTGSAAGAQFSLTLQSRPSETPYDDEAARAVAEPEPPDLLLSPAQAAALLFVHPRTVARWANAGKLKSVRTVGGHRRFAKADLIQIMAKSHGGSTVPQPPGSLEGAEALRAAGAVTDEAALRAQHGRALAERVARDRVARHAVESAIAVRGRADLAAVLVRDEAEAAASAELARLTSVRDPSAVLRASQRSDTVTAAAKALAAETDALAEEVALSVAEAARQVVADFEALELVIQAEVRAAALALGSHLAG